ncbi:MAG: hypothetical protein GY799_30050, partial [Desulfobulbaceae bacterium]|nr:hypothetical protein [Desulfobulbaceae bacterium]
MDIRIEEVCDFFIALFYEGRSPRTIKGFRSALGAIYKRLGSFNLATNEDVSDLLKGLERKRPPKDKSLLGWDVAFVLKALTEAPFEPMSTCPPLMLLWKTVFLVAMASARRVSELHALVRHPMEWGPDKSSVTLYFDPLFLPKSHRHHLGNPELIKITIPAIRPLINKQVMPEENSLCPVRALLWYIHRTDPIRRQRLALFMSLSERIQRVAVSTLSGWL